MVIVDLFAQRRAIANATNALDDEQTIEWIDQRGELTVIPVSAPESTIYLFRSNTGIEARFFMCDGGLVFLSGHTTVS